MDMGILMIMMVTVNVGTITGMEREVMVMDTVMAEEKAENQRRIMRSSSTPSSPASVVSTLKHSN